MSGTFTVLRQTLTFFSEEENHASSHRLSTCWVRQRSLNYASNSTHSRAYYTYSVGAHSFAGAVCVLGVYKSERASLPEELRRDVRPKQSRQAPQVAITLNAQSKHSGVFEGWALLINITEAKEWFQRYHAGYIRTRHLTWSINQTSRGKKFLVQQ